MKIYIFDMHMPALETALVRDIPTVHLFDWLLDYTPKGSVVIGWCPSLTLYEETP